MLHRIGCFSALLQNSAHYALVELILKIEKFNCRAKQYFTQFKVYTLTGTFGYLTFGTEVDSDILVSYGANDPLVIAARLLMAVAMITSYPILHFCGRAAFFSITGLDTFPLQTPYHERQKKEKIRRYSGKFFELELNQRYRLSSCSVQVHVKLTHFFN